MNETYVFFFHMINLDILKGVNPCANFIIRGCHSIWNDCLYIVHFLTSISNATQIRVGSFNGDYEHVTNEIDAAERSNAEAKKLVEEQREMLKQSRVEAQELIERAKKQAVDQKDAIVAAAKEEAESIKASAVQEIQREKEQAIAALQEQVASLSVQIASKVIEKELKEEDQVKLIRDYIKEVGEAR